MSFPNLSSLAVRERSLTLFFIVLSALAGIYAFSSLGRAEDPSFTVRIMLVSVIWPGATTEEIQHQVIDRLEKRVQEVEDLYRVISTIHPGRADLLVEFEEYVPGETLPERFYQVRKRMQDEALHLPKGVIGPIVNDDFSDVYFSLIALTAPGMPMRELTRAAEGIRDRMQQIEGTHKALVLGERSERVYVEFDTVRLNNLGISLQVILEAIKANNQLVPTGFLDLDGPRAYLRIDADLSDPQQLANVPVLVGDRLLHLSDFATIRRGYEDPPSYLIRASGQDAVLLGVVMKPGENGLAFGERLGGFLLKEQNRLPFGMSLTPLTNQLDAITGSINLFQIKFLVAVAVVMGISILAIGMRAGLVVGITVPLTLGLTFLLMLVKGVNLNLLTLGALLIALGLLVDDAIIAIEMMIVKMEEGWDRVQAASHAWNITAAPMLSGTLVTIAGFVPIGFAKSGVGEYAGDMFWVLAFALIVSWFVAVIFTPYLGVKFLPDIKTSAHTSHSLYETPLYRKLRAVIVACVHHRKIVVAMTMGLLILCIVAMETVVQKQFFPKSARLEVLVDIFLPRGSSIFSTDATTRKIETILANMPEVKSLSAYVGAGAPRFFISANPEQPDPSFAKIVVVGKDSNARDKIESELQRHIKNGEFPEARVRLTRLYYGPPATWPLDFRIFGPDPMKLREIGHQLRDTMAAHPNTIDPHLEWDERAPVLHLAMDSDSLRLMGLTPQDVAYQLQFQLNGVSVTKVRENIRTVEVRARALRETMPLSEIKTPDGRKVPLAQLGKLEIQYEEPVIKRYNRERFLSVQADVQGAEAPGVTMTIWSQLESLRNQLPEGYRIEIGGSVEQSAKGNASIQKLQPVMLALMLIFIMLQMRSFSGTFIVVATAPLGLIGAVAALLLFNQPFGFVALLGLIGLAGILMRNTMILTQQVQDNFLSGMDAWPAVVEATVQRARPLILTALAAVMAYLPLTQDTFWGPLAYVLIGGVAVGTIITLFFVPALYALLFSLSSRPEATNSTPMTHD
ncbi:MAG: AcrB/AcrD/AcrF family protein [Gammaproteobacteria bacterium]|nr:MAG: AcrB/AcrD/AcrF family protein [Gammaproteobacteria bacterium]